MATIAQIRRAAGEFFSALSTLKLSKSSLPALWAIIATMLVMATATPSAYGLEFPMTTRLTLPDPVNLTVKSEVSLDQALAPQAAIPVSDMAILASLSRQVEMARTKAGAKKVAKAIMKSDFSWGEKQYTCLNHLWTRESHWNYKAHNYRSGAHGIAQALPATKMEVVATDWRTNPVTQIRWGLRYIDLRYDTPCNAWAKWRHHRYY